jgi:hypothetical protein
MMMWLKIRSWMTIRKRRNRLEYVVRYTGSPYLGKNCSKTNVFYMFFVKLNAIDCTVERKWSGWSRCFEHGTKLC